MSDQAEKSGESFADAMGQAADILIQHQMDECRAQRVLAQERDRNAQHSYLELEQKYKSLYCCHAAQGRTIEQLQARVHELEAETKTLRVQKQAAEDLLDDQERAIQRLQDEDSACGVALETAQETTAYIEEERTAALRKRNHEQQEKQRALERLASTLHTLEYLTSKRLTKTVIVDALGTIKERLAKFRNRT